MCSLEELKALARASGVAVSGSKAAVEQRLLENAVASQYAHTLRLERGPTLGGFEAWQDRGMVPANPDPTGAARAGGHDNTSLKALCSARKIAASGKRFDLVLRLLQHETGKGGAPALAKVAKPRAKPMALPKPAKLRERVHKTAFPSDKVMWSWSNYKSKQHYNRCSELASKLVQEQVIDRKLIERGEVALAWEVVVAVCEDWMVGGQVRGIGYYHECCSKVTDVLEPLAKRSVAAVGPGASALAGALAFFDRAGDAANDYGYDSGYFANDWRTVANALRGAPPADTTSTASAL